MRRFIPKPHTKGLYCSYSCWVKERNIELTCLNCGKKFIRQKSRLKWGRGKTCSTQCQYDYIKNIKPHKILERECLNCNNIFYINPSRLSSRKGGGKYCSRSCRDRHWFGINTPNYINGGNDYRGANWQSQKRKTLTRDKHTCQDCGDNLDVGVHHVIPYRYYKEDYIKANHLDNLITLCFPCHRKADAAINKYDKLITCLPIEIVLQSK
jgi:hypothetical protein